MADPADSRPVSKVSIAPLLKQLEQDKTKVTAQEVANALSHIFTDQLPPEELRELLIHLDETKLDCRADVIAECAHAMRTAAAPVDLLRLKDAVQGRAVQQGKYEGGLCDIVGTGGDGHSTFNVSTTSSIVASAYLLIAKHGNKASSSKSGSADVLAAMSPTKPHLEVITGDKLFTAYEKGNYAFLFAPIFHPGMKYAAAVRRDLKRRTIFNLLGPLANPVDSLIEARLVGVARQDLGPVFIEALRLGGARKALVVCGEENLDELSCAGKTSCWQLKDESIERFTLEPADFDLPCHALHEAAPGRSPEENAAILKEILENKAGHEAIVDFVLMNTAALLVVSGVCDSAEIVEKERGPGGGLWKEGVRKAREAISSGKALESWLAFTDVTQILKEN